jgi:hypothetical protein
LGESSAAAEQRVITQPDWGPGAFIRKSIQIGHIVQTTKPYFLQTLLRKYFQDRQRFSQKNIKKVF